MPLTAKASHQAKSIDTSTNISNRIKSSQLNSRGQAGFTLIEMLVVMVLTVIVAVAGGGLFITSLYSNSKKAVLTTIKDEGDYALSQLEFLLRNSIQIVPNPAGGGTVCAMGMNNISVRSFDNGISTLSTNTNRIASKSASAANPVYLTTTAVEISAPLTFDCQATADGGKYITVRFSLRKQGDDLGNPSPIVEDFTTSVQTRN